MIHDTLQILPCDALHHLGRVLVLHSLERQRQMIVDAFQSLARDAWHYLGRVLAMQGSSQERQMNKVDPICKNFLLTFLTAAQIVSSQKMQKVMSLAPQILCHGQSARRNQFFGFFLYLMNAATVDYLPKVC